MDRMLVGCGRFCHRQGRQGSRARHRRHLHSDLELWSGHAEGYTDPEASLGMVEAHRAASVVMPGREPSSASEEVGWFIFYAFYWRNFLYGSIPLMA